MIIDRPKWRARWRGPGVCELCGLVVTTRECFHILAKGQGGGACLDVVINCLSSCAPFSGGKDCHTRHHNGSLLYAGNKCRTDELLTIVAHREGISLDVDLLWVLWWMQRLPKEANQDERLIWNRLHELKEPEREVALWALRDAGKVKDNAA